MKTLCIVLIVLASILIVAAIIAAFFTGFSLSIFGVILGQFFVILMQISAIKRLKK